MSLFNSDYIVEFEYSDGFLSSFKKSTMTIKASSEYDAKTKVKTLLEKERKYVKILSVAESNATKQNQNAHSRVSNKALEIAKQERYIKKVQKLPLTKGLMTLGITLAAFFFGWIPYWKNGSPSLIWLPIIILAIGLLVTLIVVIIYIKIRPKRLEEAERKLEMMRIH